MKKVLMLIFMFGFALSFVTLVYAQENNIDEFTLEEITVTAQKREENQQKVPVAMDTISGDEIRELGYNDLDDILSSISTVFINKAGDGLRVSIRGMSDDADTRGMANSMSNSMPTVAVNTDGIFTAGRNSGANLYDIERVEVLFGPQSTLYASNAPGGIVNIVTGNPKINKYEASGMIEYGNYNNMQTEGMVNVPVSDYMALRASFITSVRDGYLANGSDDDDTKSARLKALLAPNEKFSITLTGEYTQNGGAGLTGLEMFVNQSDVADPWDNSYEDAPLSRDKVTKKISADIEADFGFGVLTVIPAATKMRENAYQTVDDSTSYMDNRRDEKGAEARMVSSDDFHFKWIIGANIYRLEQHIRGETIGTPYYDDTVNSIKSHSFYSNVTYPVSDQFRVTGGLRYSDDTNTGCFDAVMAFGAVHRPELITYQGLDHKIGVEYDIGEDIMFYADWSTGYRVGSMGGADVPETLDAYTLGAKNRLFNNKLQLNWAAYYYDYKDYPASWRMYDPITMRQDPGANVSGDMAMFGYDLQADMILSTQDRLNISISYEHAEFAYLYFDFESPLLEDIEYTGKELTFTPDWTINAAYSHNFELANGGVLTARIDSRFQSSFRILWNDEYCESAGPGQPIYYYSYTGHNEQEAYHISNLSMTYIHPDGKWTLGGYIKNLENYAVKRSLIQGTLNIGPPRTYGAVLTVKY